MAFSCKVACRHLNWYHSIRNFESPSPIPHADAPCALCQCSVWPAFWSQAPNWPTGGEIDTFEGVNMVQNSQSSLHTEPGCTVVNSVQTSTLINSTDCSFQANNNEGCVIENPDSNSYGAAFAAGGGGVFVTEFAEAGISCVVFGPTLIPAYPSLTSQRILSCISVWFFSVRSFCGLLGQWLLTLVL